MIATAAAWLARRVERAVGPDPQPDLTVRADRVERAGSCPRCGAPALSAGGFRYCSTPPCEWGIDEDVPA